MTVQVLETGSPIGAEIRGVDLGGDVNEDTFAQIRAALDQHSMVFLRRQRLNHAAHVALARRLGALREPRTNPDPLVPGWPDLTVLSNIYENGKPVGLLEAGQYWHSDSSFKGRTDFVPI